MRIKLIAIVSAVILGLSSAAGVALADNPHCNGNSDNVHLPNHHTSHDFPAC